MGASMIDLHMIDGRSFATRRAAHFAIHCRAMRMLVVTTLIGLTLGGCGNKAAKLQGTWVGEKTEGFAADVDAPSVTAAKAMKVTFAGESLTVTAASGAQTSAFKVQKEDKGWYTLVGVAPAAWEETFVQSADGSLKWSVGKGRFVILKKR